MNSCQCLGRVRRPAFSSRLYSGVAGKGVSRPKIGRPGGQVRTCSRVRSAAPTVSLSMPKINDVMAYTLRCASRSSTAAYSPGLLNPLFTSFRLAGSMDSMPIKIHLPPEAAIRSTSSSSRNKLAQQRLRTLDVDGEIIVDEENRHLALLAAGAGLQQQQFVHHALIGAETNRVAKKSCHGAELAAVRAASPGLNWNNAK